jgi:hypothetical protein
VALLAVAGLVTVIAHPAPTTDVLALIGDLGVSALLVVLPATVVMGFMLPLTTGLLGDRERHRVPTRGVCWPPTRWARSRGPSASRSS